MLNLKCYTDENDTSILVSKSLNAFDRRCETTVVFHVRDRYNAPLIGRGVNRVARPARAKCQCSAIDMAGCATMTELKPPQPVLINSDVLLFSRTLQLHGKFRLLLPQCVVLCDVSVL